MPGNTARSTPRTTPPGAAPHAQPPPRIGNGFGHFSQDGCEYVITDFRTPRPWANIIATPRVGLAVSQAGSGFTWIDNSQLAVITRWEQDLVRDSSGKFLVLTDLDSHESWSLAPAPLWPAYDRFACHHGLGYTRFLTEMHGIAAEWTLGCHPDEAVELWHVRLRNLSSRRRRLAWCVYLEWCCGVAPSPRREFHRLFIETRFDAARRAIFAQNHMWEVPNERWGHWNTTFPYVAALLASAPVKAATGDKGAFWGQCHDGRHPAALDPAAHNSGAWSPRFGRHHDPVAALRGELDLPPEAQQACSFALAVGGSAEEATRSIATLTTGGEAPVIEPQRVDEALRDAAQRWRHRLADHQVDTPDESINHLANTWLRYQAISGRMWGRCGYYQQSGAFGFRDQLQDAQVWLTIDPTACRQQINLHAGHQFKSGAVYHWWHPLSGQGLATTMTDDLLWLAFVTAGYLRETGDFSILQDRSPFVDDAADAPLHVHVDLALDRVHARTSPRGIPLIGAGDWNDGLSACGLQERGESFWLGQFLAGVLADWAIVHDRLGNDGRRAELVARRDALVEAVNAHGWDGQWYRRATLDDGRLLGTATNQCGRIFLNAQTWAILNDIGDPDRKARCLAAIREHLVTDVGALLLAPAFDTPDEAVGYITRYAPGMRENGGVYTHAATWAIAAACKMNDRELCGRLLDAMNPTRQDPQRYWAEPYVTPGNVDGPQSPHFGRGGWTWYTGSAAWLHRVISEWVLGVRPVWDGLLIQPCLPNGWDQSRMVRPYRDATLDITVEQSAQGHGRLELDGECIDGNTIPTDRIASGTHTIHLRA